MAAVLITMVGRSAPAVLAVTGGRREAANAEAGTKRRREEGNVTAEPRNAAGAGTKRRREAEEGSSGSGGGGDGPVERRTRIRVWPPAVAQPHPLQRLVNACRAVFRGSLTAPPPAVVSLISRMLDRIGPEDVGLRAEVRFFNKMNCAGRQNPPIITCKNLYECDNFTIAVFFLPSGTVMPLHDHPGMTVFSKLLIGSAHVKSYDWINPFICVDSGLDDRSMLAKKVLDHDLTTASGTWVLYPNAGGNMHRFVAGEEGPCAFLDVLTPPYSSPSQRRSCTFYQDFPYELHPNVISGKPTEEQKSRLAWLRRIGMPKDLRVSSLPYRGPPIF